MRGAIRLTGGDLKTALSRALSTRLARRLKERSEGEKQEPLPERGDVAIEETAEGGNHGEPGE